MPEVFFISDTHFGHKNILNFKKDGGTENLRDFDDLDHMRETIVTNWNSVVTSKDKVYHLGDIAFGKVSELDVLHRLNGHKRLVKGNHDLRPASKYLEYFEEIYGVSQINGYWPVNKCSIMLNENKG